MDILDKFYADLKFGISVPEFLRRFLEVLDFVHSNDLTPQMRLAQGRVKRLRDEIAPMRAFLRKAAEDGDSVQFPLDSGPVDCNVYSVAGQTRRIQITVAQARARLNVMTELNERGIGRGYLGITDDRPTAEFVRAMNRERIAYSTSGAQRTLVSALSLCLKKKSGPKGASTLLIEAPLNDLPVSRLEETLPSLRNVAKTSPFNEVFLVGDGERRQSCYQLK
jgi:hypothetical protein